MLTVLPPMRFYEFSLKKRGRGVSQGVKIVTKSSSLMSSLSVISYKNMELPFQINGIGKLTVKS